MSTSGSYMFLYSPLRPRITTKWQLLRSEEFSFAQQLPLDNRIVADHARSKYHVVADHATTWYLLRSGCPKACNSLLPSDSGPQTDRCRSNCLCQCRPIVPILEEAAHSRSVMGWFFGAVLRFRFFVAKNVPFQRISQKPLFCLSTWMRS